MAGFFDITEDDIHGLEQKIAIITGGSSGIGFATSEFFSTKGAIVVQADLSPPPRTLPGSLYTKTDVTSWTDLTRLFRRVIDDYGRVDIVFANAGVGPKGDYLDLAIGEDGVPVEPSRLCLEINLMAVANTVALALHYMQKQDAGGNVVMTTSVAGKICILNLARADKQVPAKSSPSLYPGYQPFGHEDYTVSKHGVVGILRGVREHFYPKRPIRINAIAPSWTDTTIIG
ncbi:uncharacterized protein Z520_11952 [Fonsecaea multimorphosa CBS 102226]|uniref:Glucose 1-dehydrogenase n=1 Tax=Fonsecaea multimorphosa CBS 102226 TaxID=1442371 RepID=A0A0D2JPF4_9EURO|nr:uncharacterized protein Z520_11952 [Fonsecaea multimorphosa CBS 102226]KIX92344.1 hypothetical protein Z520_11952 [Fonsecaea multimorphosa CBS 102226]